MAGKRAFIASILIVSIIASVVYFAIRRGDEKAKQVEASKDTIRIWYTDEALTDYLDSVALSFYDETGVKVVPVLHTGLNYAEDIYEASVKGDKVPDLYIISNDSLEKVSMSGIAVPVKADPELFNGMNYPEVAINAATYNKSIMGYPFYYETAFLLYNRTYLEMVVNEANKNERTAAEYEGEGDEEGDLAGPAEPVSVNAVDLIPTSIEDIISFADKYSAPEGVENIFDFDVSDLFYNYFFTGAYMNVGGAHGDDKNEVEIYNADTVKCLMVYQELNQFFSIDSKESSYEKVITDFLDGKTIYTIATSDAIKRINDKKADGDFEWEYGVSLLPGVDSEHKAKGISITNVVAINSFTEDYDSANAFARYLTFDKASDIFQRSGKLPSAITKDNPDPVIIGIRDAYVASASLPNMIEISDFWIRLENTYMLIWDGADANDTLREFANEMLSKIKGEAVELDKVTVEVSDEEEINN